MQTESRPGSSVHRGDRWRALASTSRGLTSSEFNFTQTETEPLVPVIYVCSKYYVVQTKQTGVTSVQLKEIIIKKIK